MGKKWRVYLGCVLKPKPNENIKKKKTRKSQGLFSEKKNEGLDVSEEVDIATVNPTPPSPKPEVILIEEATDRYSVIKAENESASNAHSASKTVEDEVARDMDSDMEIKNMDANDVHFDAKGEKDDHTEEGYHVIEAKNEDTNNHNSDVKDEDDQVTDGYSVILGENVHAMNAHSFAKEADAQAMDKYSVIKVENMDAMNAHSSANDANDQAMNGYFMIEAKNEDAMNPHSAAEDVDDYHIKGGYSIIEVENEDARNPNADLVKGRYNVIEAENDDAKNPRSSVEDVGNYQTLDRYSVYETENEESKNTHSTAKDANDQATYEHSVIEVDNEDARNSHSIVRDVKNDHAMGRDSVEAENENTRDAYFDAKHASMIEVENEHSEKNAGDVDATCNYSMIKGKNENARNALSNVKDVDDHTMDGYSMVKVNNEDENKLHSVTKEMEDYQKTEIYHVTEADNMDEKKAHSVANVVEDDQAKYAHSISLISTATVEGIVVPSYEATEVKSKEEVATLKIQSAFRGYLARRSFQGMKGIKGLMRLQTLVQAQFVKRQATTTLKCMQTMARVQHQVRARQIRMYEENQALQRQLQQKHDMDKFKPNTREDWIDSPQSKEQIEANRQREQQAAIRRERELAYAYTHQLTWKSSPKQATQAFVEPDNPQWDWNWLEKRMGERPWDNRTIKEYLNSKPPSAKSVTTLAQKVLHHLNLDHVKPSPMPKKKTHTPGEISISSPQTTRKSTLTDRARVPNSSLRTVHSMDGVDARSMQSVRSERQRRHSGIGLSTRDDEIRESPRFMSPTTSAKAKSRSRMQKSGSRLDSGSSTKNKFSFVGSHIADSAPAKTRKAH